MNENGTNRTDATTGPRGTRVAAVLLGVFAIAAGIQNKILEAMSYEIPVVATSRAAQGRSAAHRTYSAFSSFSDMLYFCSVEKTIKQKFKLGIVTAIPFTRSFTYQGSEIYAQEFSNIYQGNVKMSAIPLWIKLAYQFNSGKNRDKINRTKEEIDNRPKKGF
jgi:hypothetical protein